MVDVGSSSARCWLFDSSASGRDPGPGSRVLYRWDESDGGMRMDATDLFDRVTGAIDAAVAYAREERLEIVGVAVTTFWHSSLGLDGVGRPVTPLTAWGDTRAAETARRLLERRDARSYHHRTGCFIHPSYPAVRLAWLREQNAAAMADTDAWVSFGEYMEQRLFGERRCSYSMASGSGLLDVNTLEWDVEALEIAGISARHLSPLVDFAAPLQELREPFATRWPELARTPWYPALGDGACANLGSGAVGAERLGITIGTTAAVRVLVDAPEGFHVPDDVWAYRLDRRRWVIGAALSNGGNALRFLGENLRLPDQGAWDELIRAPGVEEHGLTVLPFLVDERPPARRISQGASVVGLRLDTTPGQITRAWLEAVGYRIAELCERLESLFGANCIPRASGGALHGSHGWAQILSDVLGRTVVLPAEREETSRGAAIMALEALGAIPAGNVPEPPMAAEFRPDAQRHARHLEAARRQRRLESHLAAFDSDA